MLDTKNYNSIARLYGKVNDIKKIKAITFDCVDCYIDTHSISILYQQPIRGLSINSI